MFLTTACGLPRTPGFAEPTPTPTAAPTLTPTPTPVAEQGVSSAALAIPTPQITMPTGFTVVQDDRLRYSFAVPSGWRALDLQSTQSRTIAGMVGLGEQLEQLNTFLASPAGQMIGVIYVTDLMTAMFGGFPTILNVAVVDAPGYTAERASAVVQEAIETNLSALGEVEIGAIETVTVNNLPALRSTATADLASIGMNTTIFGKVVGLLANDKVYIMTLVAQGDQQATKEPIFDQIIGSFRPE
ncbi:MAG: hypothetical protein KF832_09290 [Caldilineaceae bacterium]|nr:hypothetical protein [Caldilineaceae bacterium]